MKTALVKPITKHIPGRGNDKMSMTYLEQLIGTEVKINRGGPDSIVGKLIAIQHDYLVLQTKDGTVVYVQFSHIKSISETKGNTSSGNRSNPTYIAAYSFHSLLQQLNHTFVQINRGGPEKIEGFIVDSSNDYLLLVSNNELVRTPIFHIKTINVLDKKGNKSSGNKSGSNKSGSNKSSSNKSSSGKKSVTTSMLKAMWKKSKIRK
jgi:spore coat protein B